MEETKIINTLKKRHLSQSGNKYEINNNGQETELMTHSLASTVVSGQYRKKAIITELPINGHLTIDDVPLYIHQVIQLSDIAHLKFTRENEYKSADYGNFKFIANQGCISEEEHSFVIDPDIINNAHQNNDPNSAKKIETTNTNNKNKTVDRGGLKNKKLEKELLQFIAKRESGVAFDTTDNCWVEATNPIFEEEFFEETKPKSDASK